MVPVAKALVDQSHRLKNGWQSNIFSRSGVRDKVLHLEATTVLGFRRSTQVRRHLISLIESVM